MSTKSIWDIKNEPTIIQHLKGLNTFLRRHFWKEDQVSLKDIGFSTSYVPTKHSKAFVINDMYERCAGCQDLDLDNAPPFKLIHAQPKFKLEGRKKFKLEGRKKPLKTHAFLVQVLIKDA
jgi:hypothetical protein